MKPLPSLPTYLANKFTWTGKSGVAEMSDFGKSRICGRVYADACDVGFNVVSRKTGVTMLFIFATSEEKDGDLLADIYKSGDFTITLLND